MRAKSPVLLLWGYAACLPSPPPLDGDETHTESESTSGWHEIDPPEAAAEVESGGPPQLGDGDGDADDSAMVPPPNAELRLLEVRFDPEGTDGALESPEVLRLINRGPEDYPLEWLRIEARSWPLIDASDLPIDHLAPGQELLLLRYRSDAENPGQANWQDGRLAVPIIHNSGLRNGDGAALAHRPDGTHADLVCWGTTPSPAPFDDPADWDGPCAPVDAGALCRLDPELDSNRASDWAPCPTADKKKPRR